MRTGNFMGEYRRMNKETKITIIVGCMAASALDNGIKAELIDFMWELEEAGEQE